VKPTLEIVETYFPYLRNESFCGVIVMNVSEMVEKGFGKSWEKHDTLSGRTESAYRALISNYHFFECFVNDSRKRTYDQKKMAKWR
jgi:hypothetical protein